MGAGHDHGPSAQEVAGSSDFRTRLAVAFGLILSIVLAQAVGAWLSGSLAILVDMVHSLVDSTGLMIALIAATLMRRPASTKRTWGFRRVESIAALLQAALLVGISVYAIIEGIERWSDPPEVGATQMIIFAAVALALNIAAMWVLNSGKNANLNMKGAFLEVLMDALGTVAVILSGILMLTTGYARADTIAAFVIAAMILPRAGLLLRDALRILMEFTPQGLDLDEVRRHILELDHVKEVHDLHASVVATGLPTLTAHIVVDDECFTDSHAVEVLQDVKQCVAEHFVVSIHHSTFQIETTRVAAGEHEAAIHD